MQFKQERREAAYILRRLYERGLTTTSGGNVSVRAGGDRFVVTPSGNDKARVRARDVVVMGFDGVNHTPDLRPSVEASMHARILQVVPGVGAVVHAHPPTASAFTCAETPIDLTLVSETYAILEQPVMAPYAISGSDALAESVARCAARSSTVLLQNHGVLVTGATLMQAYDRLEVLEAAARITLIVRRLEGVRRLTAEEQAELDLLMGRRPA